MLQRVGVIQFWEAVSACTYRMWTKKTLNFEEDAFPPMRKIPGDFFYFPALLMTRFPPRGKFAKKGTMMF